MVPWPHFTDLSEDIIAVSFFSADVMDTYAAVVWDGELLLIIGFVSFSEILGDLKSPLVSRLIDVGMKSIIIILLVSVDSRGEDRDMCVKMM